MGLFGKKKKEKQEWQDAVMTIYACRGASPQQKAANLRETISLQRQMGWTVLLNENIRITRNGDGGVLDGGNKIDSAAVSSSIVIAGMENDGDGKRFPMKGDLPKTLCGVNDTDFVHKPL